MNPATIAQIINAMFSVIAGLRRFIGTNEQIKARFERVDRGEDAITIAEVEAALDDWQQAIDDGRSQS